MKDKFDVGQIVDVSLDDLAKKKNVNISKDSNKFDLERLLKIEVQLRRLDKTEDAMEAAAIFNQLKKFLMDRSMLKFESHWETTPCLLDDDGNEVLFTEDSVIIRDKWAR